MTYKKILVFCIAFAAFISAGKAQDLHYSQFYNAPLVVSPALTGIFKGDKRVSISFRDQWRSVAVPWTTFTLGYDQKVYLNKRPDLFLGLGGFFNYDQQGDSKLNLGSINLSGSITKIISPKHLITGGLTLGYANKGFDSDALRFDFQFQDGIYSEGNDLMVQDQGPYSEIIFGTYLDIYLDKSRGKEKNLHLGAGYRTSGAIYPKIALEWQKRYFVAVSYDIDCYIDVPTMNLRIINTILLLLGVCASLTGQTKKAFLEAAEIAISDKDFHTATQYFKEALEFDTSDVFVLNKSADAARQFSLPKCIKNWDDTKTQSANMNYI